MQGRFRESNAAAGTASEPAVMATPPAKFWFHSGAGALRFRGGGPKRGQARPPPPANQMMNWLFKYYVTALPGGSAPPP